ncbi:hypothetical protein ABZX95_07980 [Streptomyces sp. NPDC004232]|uniref:hypothetical protein n=1 Tax=unclassified Streptomyces TaxID=2593676 RepID=UPI001D1BEA88|nr:hypothetical protein [Streptomyces sp. tea 10]
MRKFLGPPLCTTTGARLTLPAGPRRTRVARGGRVKPADDAMNATTSEPGTVPARRTCTYPNAFGHGSDVCDPGPALPGGGDPPSSHLTPQPDAAWAGVLLAAVGAQA